MFKKTYKQFSIAAFVLWSLLAHNLNANTFTVTTTNVAGPGSLAAAILQANQTPGSNIINITVTNQIIQTIILPIITNSVSIIGTANTAAIISGGGTQPIFSYAAGTTNSIFNLVIRDGYQANAGPAAGAAIKNSGTLFVNFCVLTNNQAPNGFGGAINNSGTMFISSSVIAGNKAEFGGGIYNSGTLTVCQSTFQANGCVGQNGGDGGSASVSTGGGGGGGGGLGGALFIFSGNVSITNSSFITNTVQGGKGGNGGSYINYGSGNIGGDGGGYNAGNGGGAALGNGSAGGAGGFGGGGGGGGGGYSGNSGLIWLNGYGGSAGTGGFGGGGGGGGGWDQDGFFGDGGFGGGGGGGYGGGIFIFSGTLSLINSTIACNSCFKGSGGIHPQVFGGFSFMAQDGQGFGGGIYNYGGSVVLLNTIVAGNIATTSSPDLLGSFNSLGNNLIGNNEGASGLSLLDFHNHPISR